MSKTLLVAGVAALVAWTVVGAEPAGTSESKLMTVSASALSALDGLQIQEAGRSGSTVVWIEVVNASPGPLDLSRVKIGDGAGKALSGGGLKLVRGSFVLETGDTALIVTHPAVPTDDVVRLQYEHLYVAGDSDGIASGFARLTLVDGAGVIIESLDVALAPRTGHCCNSLGGGGCTICGGPSCGLANVCVAAVTKNACCLMSGCCWDMDMTLQCTAPPSSCAGTGSSTCCL